MIEALCIWAACSIQSDPQEAYVLKASIESGTENGKPVFVFSGTSDLPDGTLLYVDFYRAGTQEGTQLFTTGTRVEKGAWRGTAGVFAERNLPGKYYLRVRFDISFQDRKDAGEAILKSSRNRSGKAEAWIQIGGPEEWERSYREVCERLAREIDEMQALAKEAGERYSLYRKGANPKDWKRQMEELRERVAAIERRNADRAEYRYLDLSEISNVGMEQLRGVVWALIDSYVRAAGAVDQAPAIEREAEARLDTLRQFIRKFKSQMRLPYVSSKELGVLARDLKGSLERAVESCRALETNRTRAKRVNESRLIFEALLIDLAYVVGDDRYAEVQELSQAANELFDRIGNPEFLANPDAMKEASPAIESLQKRIERFGP